MKHLLLVLLEFFTEEHIQTTGERAEFSGVYRSGDQYIPLAKRERLPPSSDENQKWILVCKL